MGTHEQLLEEFPDGTYSSFCKKQQSAEEEAKVESDPLDDGNKVETKLDR